MEEVGTWWRTLGPRGVLMGVFWEWEGRRAERRGGEGRIGKGKRPWVTSKVARKMALSILRIDFYCNSDDEYYDDDNNNNNMLECLIWPISIN